MVQKLRVALALQPVATALFRQFAVPRGPSQRPQVWRARVWRHLDDARTGMLPFVFEDGFGFEAWADYALDVPMYFVYRDGRLRRRAGAVLPRFPAWRSACAAGREADAQRLGRSSDDDLPRGADQALHRDARRRWRAVAAAVRAARLLGRPSLRPDALDAAWDLARGLDAETREGLRVAASVEGLQGRAGCVSPARPCARGRRHCRVGVAGARARPGDGGLLRDETHFLNALKDSVETGRVPADDLLDRYHGEWGGRIDPVYDALSY